MKLVSNFQTWAGLSVALYILCGKLPGSIKAEQALSGFHSKATVDGCDLSVDSPTKTQSETSVPHINMQESAMQKATLTVT